MAMIVSAIAPSVAAMIHTTMRHVFLDSGASLGDSSRVLPTSPSRPTSNPTDPPTPAPTSTATPRPRPQPDGVKRSAHVPILMYHYISAPPDPADRLRVDLSVSPEMFAAQMQWLAEKN